MADGAKQYRISGAERRKILIGDVRAAAGIIFSAGFHVGAMEAKAVLTLEGVENRDARVHNLVADAVAGHDRDSKLLGIGNHGDGLFNSVIRNTAELPVGRFRVRSFRLYSRMYHLITTLFEVKP